jgi:nitrile hydratase subunit beta
MNGVHDLGGMDGFGPVVREPNEPVFHEPWERRVFGMVLASMAQGLCNIDETRHAIERMAPAHYLGSTYYEHWLAGLERLMLEKGKLSTSEVETRLREIAAGSPPPAERQNPGLAQALLQGIHAGAPVSRGKGRARFREGQAVRVRKMNPHGHTRCPRYVRGAKGTIEHVRERFVFPDAHAHGGGEAPQVLYTVGFAAAELWGADAEGRGGVYVDLWESYLEPAGAGTRALRRRAPRRKPVTHRARRKK